MKYLVRYKRPEEELKYIGVFRSLAEVNIIIERLNAIVEVQECHCACSLMTPEEYDLQDPSGIYWCCGAF